jgi:hypothetical protein
MNFKFNLQDKLHLKDIVDYFKFYDFPVIMEQLEIDKKKLYTNINYKGFIHLYNKKIDFSQLPPIKNNVINGLYNIINEINFIKVKKYFINS